MTDFSSRSGFLSVNKPDITALGWKVISSRTNSTTTLTLSGTSMATPVVTGIMAKLYSKKPTITADQAKAMLMANARKDKLKPTQYVSGSGIASAEKVLSV
jgi:serine protease AprX